MRHEGGEGGSPARRRRAGFTLIEIFLAISLVAKRRAIETSLVEAQAGPLAASFAAQAAGAIEGGSSSSVSAVVKPRSWPSASAANPSASVTPARSIV